MPLVTGDEPATEPEQATTGPPLLNALLVMVDEAERRGIRMALEAVHTAFATYGAVSTHSADVIHKRVREIATRLGVELPE